jgi:hypothetical protein
MKSRIVLFAALAAQPAAAAAVSYTGPAYSQNFDSLAATGLDIAYTDESTLEGWTAYSGDSGYSGTGPFAFTLGTANGIADAYDTDPGGSGTGELYAYGSVGAPDRALGSLASGTPDEFFHVLHVTNDTGLAGTGFTLEYTGEQWRRGTNSPQRPESLLFYFRVGGTAFDDTGTWTEVTSLHFTSPNAAAVDTGALALDGNAGGNQTILADTVVASFPAGEHLWFAWVDPDNTGTDHGLAIDDLELTLNLVPEPGCAALTLLPALLLLRRRRD